MACSLDSGDVAMMMVSTAFVMLQTPAMGLCQAGLIRRKNALSMLMQTVSGMVIGSLLWFVIGFTLTFGKSKGGFIGAMNHSLFLGVDDACPYPEMGDATNSIPASLFAAFQMMFALMVPVIVTGAWAERMTFNAFLLFVSIWPIIVYYPLAHWLWNINGWLSQLGAIDFAGGIVIHLSTGVAAIVVTTFLQGRMKHRGESKVSHHSLPLSVIGGSIIWGGWYFFNAGSAYKANQVAGTALLNTHLSACSGAFTWFLLSYHRHRVWKLTDIINGAFAGLAGITAGSGYIHPGGALVIGLLVGPASFVWAIKVKPLLGLDDALDVAALQGVPGLLGSLLMCAFIKEETPILFGYQVLAVVVAIFWSGFWTSILMKLIKSTVGIDVDPETEEIGLDAAQIGEQAYDENLNALLDIGKMALATKLCDASRKGDWNRVQTLISAGADPNQGDYDGRTPLHLAAAEGHVQIAQILIRRYGVDINPVDRYGNTPLADAVRHNHRKMIDLLEENEGHMNFNAEKRNSLKGSDFSDDIIQACASGNFEKVRLILKSNPKQVEVYDYDKRSPLHLAAAEGYFEIVELLLKNGADPNVVDRWGQTPYDDSVRFKHFQCANILKPVAGEGFAVITTGNGDLIPNDAFEVPTHSTEKQSLLLKKIETDTFSSKKATSDWKDAIDSEAAVRTLMQAVSDGDQEEFMRLIAKGADPASCDYDGRTPLHLASCFGHLKIVLYLLTQARVNPNCFDRFGRTPLQDAVTYGHPEITAVLKANGATVTDAGLGKKLCQAAFSGNLEALIQLEHMGANLNCGDYDGRTALHLASSEGHLEIVQWLLSKNVHTSPTDRWGGTPLGDAIRSGHRVIVEYLEHQCHK